MAITTVLMAKNTASVYASKIPPMAQLPVIFCHDPARAISVPIVLIAAPIAAKKVIVWQAMNVLTAHAKKGLPTVIPAPQVLTAPVEFVALTGIAVTIYAKVLVKAVHPELVRLLPMAIRETVAPIPVVKTARV